MNKTSAPEPSIEHFHAVAARKAGEAGWEPISYEWVGDALLMKGGVPRLLKSGPRKGDKAWDPQSTSRVVVTEAEAAEEAVRQAAEADVVCGQSAEHANGRG